MITRSNSRICCFSLRSWAPRAARHRRGQPRELAVTCIGDDIEQLLDTLASDRRDDPELGKMGADRIDHRGLLADEEMARAVEHQAALLLGRLGRTNRMLALVTASQMASASAASFFCRLT